jgi:hypothetical protein
MHLSGTRILHMAAPRLAEARPDLPPAMDLVVARCLEKDPGARFADVAELASALAPFAPDGARAVERIARVLGRSDAPPASMQASVPVPSAYGPAPAYGPPPYGAPPPYGPPPMPPPRPTGDAWGATQARIPKRSTPWVVLGILGGLAVLGVGAVVALRVLQAQVSKAAVSIVVPPPSAASADLLGVKLAPPAETTSANATPSAAPPPAPTPSSEPAAAHTRTPPPRWRPGPAPAPAPTPAPAPAPAPTPAPEPTDPLHMGIK